MDTQEPSKYSQFFDQFFALSMHQMFNRRSTMDEPDESESYLYQYLRESGQL